MKGNLIGIASARPGQSGETTGARHHKITAHLRVAGLGALADLGFVGLDDQADDGPVIITGHKATKNHKHTDTEKEANRAQVAHRVQESVLTKGEATVPQRVEE